MYQKDSEFSTPEIPEITFVFRNFIYTKLTLERQKKKIIKNFKGGTLGKILTFWDVNTPPPSPGEYGYAFHSLRKYSSKTI